MQERDSMYDESISRRGGKLATCVWFIAGKKIRIARPSGPVHQRALYSRQKRVLCLSHRKLTTPNGLIFLLYGPVEGRQPDAFYTMHLDWMQLYVTV